MPKPWYLEVGTRTEAPEPVPWNRRNRGTKSDHRDKFTHLLIGSSITKAAAAEKTQAVATRKSQYMYLTFGLTQHNEMLSDLAKFLRLPKKLNSKLF